jgi:aryl-alcohol dehydrogenase-like predicted oxidoreductase
MGTWQSFDTSGDRAPIVDEALSVGMNLFDSSPMYGRAEETLAKALKGRRNQAIIATKIWTSSPSEGREQANHALRLLGHIEIYQVHNLVNWPAQLKLLEQLKEEGKVDAIGATHYDPRGFDDLCDLMSTGRLDMVQVPYNPRRREAERRVLPLAAELGLGVLTHSPMRFGVLERPPKPEVLKTFGVQTWGQAILKWIASDPRVSCALTATKTPGRPSENAQAGNPPWFDADQRERLAALMG